VTLKHSQLPYKRVVKLCLRLHWWSEFVWAERNRSEAGQKVRWAKRSGEWQSEKTSRAERSAEREVGERERSGERRSQKWALTQSGKTARFAALQCSVTDAQTDGRLTTAISRFALRASRGNNWSIFNIVKFGGILLWTTRYIIYSCMRTCACPHV